MLQNYLPVLIFLAVAAGIGVLLMTMGFLFGSGKKYDEKLSPYECGFEPFEDSRTKFDVRYYLVAILFIIFVRQGFRPKHVSIERPSQS